MKINWKVRLKNPIFWVAITSAIATFVYTILGMFEIVPGISKSDLIEMISVIISGLTTLGVLVDPTTAGISDSNQAMTYTKPKEDSNDDYQ